MGRKVKIKDFPGDQDASVLGFSVGESRIPISQGTGAGMAEGVGFEPTEA